MTMTETTTTWSLRGKGYEFCNCQAGCTCNFSGFPSSPDGSCKAAVGVKVIEGYCGKVDPGGIDAVAIIDWPKAIHDGNGKAIFVVPPKVTDEQLGCMAQIFTGQLGGLPWSILGTTFTVAGVVRAAVNIKDDGIYSGFDIPGVGSAQGGTLKNLVTGRSIGSRLTSTPVSSGSAVIVVKEVSMSKPKVFTSNSTTAIGSSMSSIGITGVSAPTPP